MSEHLTAAVGIANTPDAGMTKPAKSRTDRHKSVIDGLAGVAHREGLSRLSLRLAELWGWLEHDLAGLEAALNRVGASETDVGWRSARYLLARPGKRIRPVCLALAARLGGREMDLAVREAAIACELVHAATLLHDDVIDEGDLRRGAPASRRVYGNSACVLGGDQLLVDALRHVGRAVPSMRSELVETLSEMVGAEALQLQRRHHWQPDADAYMAIVRGKTASLFRWALQAGGELGDLSAQQKVALGDFGMSLGIAFQMVDDVLDLEGDPLLTGKSAFADLREGKLTWPLLLAAQRSDEVQDRLRYVASSHADIDAEVAAETVKLVQATGAIADARTEATRHGEHARAQLDALPRGRANDALGTIVDAALGRKK